jgi:hypothetical protein
VSRVRVRCHNLPHRATPYPLWRCDGLPTGLLALLWCHPPACPPHRLKHFPTTLHHIQVTIARSFLHPGPIDGSQDMSAMQSVDIASNRLGNPFLSLNCPSFSPR